MSNLCPRQHTEPCFPHLEQICPENNSEVTSTYACIFCYKLARILKGTCQRLHENDALNHLNHSDHFCPEMGDYYCKCVMDHFLLEKLLQAQIYEELLSRGCTEATIVDTYIQFTSLSGADKIMVIQYRSKIDVVIYHLDEDSNLIKDETSRTFSDLPFYNMEETLDYAVK